ncbi:MAG: hypothetical protein ABGZ35_18650 [Planctomycetaceae bacterium]|jgi:hypothetical protein
MSNDTDFKLELSCPSREQLEHVLGYIEFKKSRWDSWESRGSSSKSLLARVGAKSFAAVVSWGLNLEGEIEEDSYGRASICATAWANQNVGNAWISGEDGEIADLRGRFSFLTIEGTYKDEYGNRGDV